MMSEDSAQQEREWGSLYASILEKLRQFGKGDRSGKADYLLVDDNYGWSRHTIEIHGLRMLQPAVVKSLQGLLREFPNWEIVIAVDIPGTENTWPRMGLTVRVDEIVDDLRREFLPDEFRKLVY
jgi:hypothetical protein